ncbi:putative non-specific serine/threonine protein kinase [Helianthus annuus]|nr:putative non-specific serine/threonine protein kinase [Helianthus annuus]
MSFNLPISFPLLKPQIGKLVKLKSLDLSYNFINGSIPNSFSDLRSLTSLNLAHNNLTGQIPVLGWSTDLAVFNVSYNNLSGRVPDQLSSKFDPSVFIGNLDLCGYSHSTMSTASPVESQSHRRKTNTKNILLILGGVLIAVFLLVCCVLLCCSLKKEYNVKQKDSEQGRAVPAKEIPVEETAATTAVGGRRG